MPGKVTGRNREGRGKDDAAPLSTREASCTHTSGGGAACDPICSLSVVHPLHACSLTSQSVHCVMHMTSSHALVLPKKERRPLARGLVGAMTQKDGTEIVNPNDALRRDPLAKATSCQRFDEVELRSNLDPCEMHTLTIRIVCEIGGGGGGVA